MPGAVRGHAFAFDHGNQVVFGVGAFEGAIFAVQVIKGDIDSALHLFSRHRSLQYLTSVQFLAHFLRHSKSRPQRAHFFGAKPFLTCAMRPMRQW